MFFDENQTKREIDVNKYLEEFKTLFIEQKS